MVWVPIFQSLESAQLPTHSIFIYHQDAISHQTVLETFTATLYLEVISSMRCQAIKNEAEELCNLLLWAANSEAAFLGCTSMVRQALNFQPLQNIPQLSSWKELYKWAHSILCKSQCTVRWDGLGESGLPSPSPSPVSTGTWQRTMVGSHILIVSSCLRRDHISKAGW